MITAARVDIYSQVTDRIVQQLEQGGRPWFQPWTSARHSAGSISRPLRHDGQRYQGINVLMLWASAEIKGYVSPFWLTFRQAKGLGAFVRKGEKGSPVMNASTFQKTWTAEDGQEVEDRIPFLKQYTVFNADQIEGLPHHFHALIPQPQRPRERIVRAEWFFTHTAADIRTGGNRAYYSIGSDHIQMPPFEMFRDGESHASTLPMN